MPRATCCQSLRLSYSCISSTEPTVTSSFGAVTSVKSSPVSRSRESSCHTPSYRFAGAAAAEPGGVSSALNECERPEK